MLGQRSFTCPIFLLVVCIDKPSSVDTKVRIDPRRNDLKVPIPVPMASPTPDPGPHIMEDSPKHVLAAVGSPALVPCKTRSIGSKSVSWIRHRDLHVLTVGSFTFTNDARFSAHREQSTGDWVLVLRNPEPSDSGLYECSISTKPVTAITVKLQVVVPTVELLGGGAVYLDRGSTLNLTCMVHFSPTPPDFILWYHRDKLVNYGQPGRSISVKTDHFEDTTRSSLLVENATTWDSGVYSCKPSNAKRASIKVHVLTSETPAAMQTTTSGCQLVHIATTSALAYFCLSLTLFLHTLRLL